MCFKLAGGFATIIRGMTNKGSFTRMSFQAYSRLFDQSTPTKCRIKKEAIRRNDLLEINFCHFDLYSPSSKKLRDKNIMAKDITILLIGTPKASTHRPKVNI